ncbi:MAG: hypothetical protein CL902_01230 [Dehalococcoidia bacterium]|nr:hypothetical protein [Dehalococcoidia bacterium]
MEKQAASGEVAAGNRFIVPDSHHATHDVSFLHQGSAFVLREASAHFVRNEVKRSQNILRREIIEAAVARLRAGEGESRKADAGTERPRLRGGQLMLLQRWQALPRAQGLMKSAVCL